MARLKALDDFVAGMRPARVSPTRRAGTAGTAIHGGYIQPEDTSSDLVGRDRYKTFSEMLVNSCIVGASVRLFTNMVGAAEWKVEPAKDGGAKADDVAEAVDEMLFKRLATPWHRVVRRASMYKFYGFSFQEWTARRLLDMGLVGYDDIEPRPQITIERWDVNEAGKVVGLIQRSPQTMEELYLPRAKGVYLVDDSLHDSPEGLGLFRHIVEANRRLERYQQLEGWGYETDLRGIPVGRGPFQELREMAKAGKLTDAQVAEIEQPLKDFIQNHIRTPQQGLLLDSLVYKTTDERETPSGVPKWAMNLLKAGSSNLADAARAIQRINREMARVLGTEHLLLGESGGGSLAMAQEKGQSFALIVDSSLKELTEAFEDDVLGPLMWMNGWAPELKPTLKTEKLQHRGVTEVTAALADLASAGATFQTSDEAILEVLDMLGLTRPDVLELDMGATLVNARGEPAREVPDPEKEKSSEDDKDDGPDEVPEEDEDDKESRNDQK